MDRRAGRRRGRRGRWRRTAACSLDEHLAGGSEVQLALGGVGGHAAGAQAAGPAASSRSGLVLVEKGRDEPLVAGKVPLQQRPWPSRPGSARSRRARPRSPAPAPRGRGRPGGRPGLDVVGRRGQAVRHEAAGHRPQRHDERVDADVDGPPAALDGQLGVLAHAEDHVGRDLARRRRPPPPAPRPGSSRRCRSRALAGATRASTSGSNDSTWMPTESMPTSWTWSITSRSAGGSNCTSTGRPVASLTAGPQRPT